MSLNLQTILRAAAHIPNLGPPGTVPHRHAGLDFKLTGVEHAHVVKEVLA